MHEHGEPENIFRLFEQLIRALIQWLKNHTSREAFSAEGKIMPARIVVGGNGATFRFTEFAGLNGTGNVVPPSGPITFASDNPAVATVDNTTQVMNADGSVSVQVQAVAANPDGSDATANITGVDPASANKVTAGDVLTVGAATAPPPPVAQSATGVLTAN